MSIIWNGKREGLNPAFADAIDRVLGLLPDTWEMTYGFRTFDEQNALYQKHLAGGPLAAPPGHSAHEHGLAVDVALLVGGHESWDTSNPAWPRLWQAIRKSPDLHSGMDFPEGEQDPDHIESYSWAYSVGGQPSVRDQLKSEGKW